MASVKLTIYAEDIDAVIQSYDAIRIKRSIDGEEGVYELITDDAPTKAVLLAPTAGAYSVSGKLLTTTLDSDDSVNAVFTGTDPLDASALATQINAAMGEVIASEEAGTGKLKLQSNITGTASKLVVEGNAVSHFGWTDGQQDTGEEAHITLVAGQNLYVLTDNNGSSGYYYKSQYYNTDNGLESLDSDPFKGDPGTLVSGANLSLAEVDLVDGRGIALPNQEISFYSMHEPLLVEGYQIGLTRAPFTITTDNAGHAEISLVRGFRFKVVFEGTNFIREITVPDQSSFDLLIQMGDAPDPFGVVELPFPFAIRRTT